MTINEAVELLEQQEWKFAKTMPQHPHWYSLRDNWKGDSFEEVVELIRKEGYDEQFYLKFFRMFNANGFKYWTMGAPLGETILINRAEVNYNSEYDDIAEEYQEMWSTPEALEEDRELFKLLDIKEDVLDIGCGQGLALDHIKPVFYTGIDPSKGMLKIARQKYPEHNFICSSIKDFYGSKYDTILALYGTASYFSDEDKNKIKSMLKKGGKAYLMTYKEGYTPVTHVKTGIGPKTYPNKDKGMEFNNHIIVTYENLS